ncbi:MAG: hypothetical protein AB8D52_11230 [Gammaproteobacteria bacterium]
MAQFQFESDDRDEIRTGRRSRSEKQERQNMRAAKSTSSAVDSFMSFFVRLMGLFTLLAGLWVGGLVISEVLGLYKGPHNIERFADAIDSGSNLDKVLASFSSKKTKKVKRREGLIDEPEVTTTNDDALRISYFLAWIIAIFLLMLIGRLAILAIKTGGELALYDLQVKKFARQLVEEVREPDKRHK